MSVVAAMPADIAERARTGRSPEPARAVAVQAPLRILTFMHGFAPGGVERVAARLHGAWTASGIDARMILADGSIAAPIAIDAVTQIGPRPRRHAVARFLALLRGLPGEIAADRPHVLFCAGNTYAGLAVALRLLLGSACPPIVAKISNDLVRPDMAEPTRLAYRLWLRAQGRYIDHFVGMAPAMRGEIAHLIGVPQSRISVIADPALSAADLVRLASARDAASRDRPGRHYLAVGRLVRQKNFAVAIEAFARIAGAHDTLTILGDGAERPALERLAMRLGVAHAVRMPGHVDPLDRWLGEADAFVLSSDYEGVPAVLIEALAAGLPIVATDCCVSMRDLLGHGALGRIVAVGDVAALAAAMAAIGPEPAGTVSARRAAVTAFTIEQASDRYLDVMRAVIAARASHGASHAVPHADPVSAPCYDVMPERDVTLTGVS